MRVIVAVLLVLALAACGDEVAPQPLIGELASDRIELTAESSEPIIEILVAEGETVSQGQILLRQNPTRAQANLDQAEAIFGQARTRLDELVRGPRSERIAAARARVEGAVQELEFRENEFQRAHRVYEKGLTSQEIRDAAKAALDAARSNISERRAQLAELLTGTTIEELEQAEYAMKQAEAQRNAARLALDRTEIRSPVDGVVDSRVFEVGERPMPGQPVIVVLAGEQPHARIYVPENLRVRIMPGTVARIRVDGLEDEISGRVRWVSSEAVFTPYFALTERDRGRLSFIAKVDITETRDRLPDGIPVEVQIESQ